MSAPVETVTPDRSMSLQIEALMKSPCDLCAAATSITDCKRYFGTSVDYFQSTKHILEAFTKSYNQMQL